MKKNKIIFTSLIIIIFILTMYLSYTLKLNDLSDNFLHLITYRFNNDYKFKFNFVDFYLKFNSNSNYFKISNKLDSNSLVVNNQVYNTDKPIIYIYSTHSNEEYSYNKNDVYNIIPTVKTASYILEDELKKLGINSIIEEGNTIDILNNRGLLYKDSYKISRELLENKKLEYSSLSYFIDVHRDSVKKSITTTLINDKSYAKVMFVLGLENPNYLENKKVITEINDYLNLNYPGLSRGIYEKKGSGVNGVYNQDLSKNVMLIEIGGVDNTLEEVSNSVKAISNAIYNYINNHKTTN